MRFVLGSLLLLLSFHVFAVDAFQSAPFSALTTVNRNSRRATSQNDNWTLDLEWSLIDAVPKFTVGSSKERRTFWTQLLLSTPELSSSFETIEDLQYRYTKLMDADSSLARPGDSPPVLQEWEVTSLNHITGIYEGRRVSFQSQLIGQLLSNNDATSAVCGPVAGGFVEAVGGRIYELGQQSVAPTIKTVEENDSKLNGPTLFSTRSAAVASSILAAAVIGYNAGSIPQQVASVPPPTSSALVVVVSKKTVSSPSPKDTIGNKLQSSSKRSIPEERARMEYKVLRDERVLNTLTTKLASDNVQLLVNQKLVDIASSSASAVGDNAEVQSLRNHHFEHQSWIERRMVREERVIQTISDRLPQERQNLERLLVQEAAAFNMNRQGPN